VRFRKFDEAVEVAKKTKGSAITRDNDGFYIVRSAEKSKLEIDTVKNEPTLNDIHKVITDTDSEIELLNKRIVEYTVECIRLRSELKKRNEKITELNSVIVNLKKVISDIPANIRQSLDFSRNEKLVQEWKSGRKNYSKGAVDDQTGIDNRLKALAYRGSQYKPGEHIDKSVLAGSSKAGYGAACRQCKGDGGATGSCPRCGGNGIEPRS